MLQRTYPSQPMRDPYCSKGKYEKEGVERATAVH